MAVEDANLAVNGTSSATVAVSVEGNGLDKVFVAVLEVELEGRFFLQRRLDGGGHGGVGGELWASGSCAGAGA